MYIDLDKQAIDAIEATLADIRVDIARMIAACDRGIKSLRASMSQNMMDVRPNVHKIPEIRQSEDEQGSTNLGNEVVEESDVVPVMTTVMGDSALSSPIESTWKSPVLEVPYNNDLAMVMLKEPKVHILNVATNLVDSSLSARNFLEGAGSVSITPSLLSVVEQSRFIYPSMVFRYLTPITNCLNASKLNKSTGYDSIHIDECNGINHASVHLFQCFRNPAAIIMLGLHSRSLRESRRQFIMSFDPGIAYASMCICPPISGLKMSRVCATPVAFVPNGPTIMIVLGCDQQSPTQILVETNTVQDASSRLQLSGLDTEHNHIVSLAGLAVRSIWQDKDDGNALFVSVMEPDRKSEGFFQRFERVVEQKISSIVFAKQHRNNMLANGIQQQSLVAHDVVQMSPLMDCIHLPRLRVVIEIAKATWKWPYLQG